MYVLTPSVPSGLASVVASADDSSGGSIEWPTVILILGLSLLAFFVFVAIAAIVSENRKMRINAGQDEAVRQLVNRYEQLASTTLDAQQRIAADVAELRSRTSSIEQILRSVE